MSSTNIVSPADYRLPYDQWNPNQLESLTWVERAGERSTFIITQQPTGSGKSAVAMALEHNLLTWGSISKKNQVIVLTHSRNLQNQYRQSFSDCHVHYGRNNYPCVLPDRRIKDSTAEDCQQERMQECIAYDDCPYVISKGKARSRDRVALNYAYWMVAGGSFRPAWLVMDEAHTVANVVLDYVGLSIGEHTRNEWSLPDFPSFDSGSGSSWSLFGDDSGKHEGAPKALIVADWLSDCITSIRDRNYCMNIKTVKAMVLCRKAKRLIAKLEGTRQALREGSDKGHWFIRFGKSLGYNRGKSEPALICKPLTARYDFLRFVERARHVLLMSATIGNVDALVEELGIDTGNFSFRNVPNQFLPSERAIHALPAPRMGRKAAMKDPKIWDKQADVIAKAILDQPHDWSGLVLVTRKTEAKLLAERLARRGLQDRIYVMRGADGTYTPTEQQVQSWQEHKQQYPNAICLTWSLWEGYDGLDERIVIAAKCLSADTKILGPEGYINIENARVGQEVFAVNDNGDMIVDRVLSVIKKPQVGKMLRIKGERLDLLVTPDHGLLYKQNYSDKSWSYDTAEARSVYEMKTGCVLPIVPRAWEGIDQAYVNFGPFLTSDTQSDGKVFWSGKSTAKSKAIRIPLHWPIDAFLRVAGWFISEGHSQVSSAYKTSTYSTTASYGIAFTQDAGRVLDSILSELNGLEINAKKRPGSYKLTICSQELHTAFTEWFGVGARNKRIPRWILELPTGRLRVLFNAMMDGDSIINPNSESLSYSTSSERLKDNFCELCLKIGYSPVVRYRNHNYDIGIARSRICGTVKPYQIVEEEYKGVVWCVTTRSGNILTARNGKFTFTKNCPFPFLGSDYERARMRYSATMFRQRAAWQLEQGLGRTRRGRKQDYDMNGTKQGYVAIADGNWTRVKSAMDRDILEAIVT